MGTGALVQRGAEIIGRTQGELRAGKSVWTAAGCDAAPRATMRATRVSNTVATERPHRSSDPSRLYPFGPRIVELDLELEGVSS